MNCKLCSNELNHPSMPDNEYTWYCYSCKQCKECYKLLDIPDIQFCIKYRTDLLEKYGEHGNVHCLCLSNDLRYELENKKVEVTQKHLDLLNTAHLMVMPNISLSIDSNVKVSEIQGIAWFNQLSSLDEKYLALRKMESLAACFSLLMKKEPGTATLRIDLNTASSRRFEEATRAASKQDAKRVKCSKCNDKFLEPDIVEHFKNCVGAPPKTKAKIQKKAATEYEKAVDLFLKYGMTVAEAEEATQAAFLAQGKAITRSKEETQNVEQ